jgi:hypothetical protein
LEAGPKNANESTLAIFRLVETMRNLILLTLGFSLVGAMAQADKVKMLCRREKDSYVVTYDIVNNRLKTNNPNIPNNLLVIKRVQNDEDGILIWSTVPAFGGERDMLTLFGKEKWMKYFYGNGSEVTDKCM